MRRLVWVAFLGTACSDYELNSNIEAGEEEPEAMPLAEPVAIAGPSVRVKRNEETVLDAAESYDPDDWSPELDYVWWVESEPNEAQYAVSEFEIASPVFSAETLGLYEIGLMVIDSDGLESVNPAATRIEVLPWENLEVELSWGGVDVDLDLHLVRPGGSYYSDDDCFFGNPLPDWGVEGDSSDDPYLSLDSEDSSAPEHIDLEQPEEGMYEVFVHYFNSRQQGVTATPTITVMAEGAVVATDMGPALTSPGQVWRVGTLDWSTLSWVSSSEVTTHEGLGGPPVNQ